MIKRHPLDVEFENETEKRIIKKLREEIYAHIIKKEFTKKDLAERLGLRELGIENCFQQYWNINKTLRIAHLLGMDIKIKIE